MPRPPPSQPWEERIWWHSADSSSFITLLYKVITNLRTKIKCFVIVLKYTAKDSCIATKDSVFSNVIGGWKTFCRSKAINKSLGNRWNVTRPLINLRWGLGSLGLRPPPFDLPFAFTIIHGIGRSAKCVFHSHVLLWTQTKGKNGGGLETRL